MFPKGEQLKPTSRVPGWPFHVGMFFFSPANAWFKAWAISMLGSRAGLEVIGLLGSNPFDGFGLAFPSKSNAEVFGAAVFWAGIPWPKADAKVAALKPVLCWLQAACCGLPPKAPVGIEKPEWNICCWNICGTLPEASPPKLPAAVDGEEELIEVVPKAEGFIVPAVDARRPWL